jgi:Flp pilus assembly protein TadD
VLVREFDERARRERNPVRDMLVAAVAVHTAGDLADAERRYEAILKRDPRAALAANNLAALYVERGTNLLYAEQLALSAAEQVPTNGNVFDTLGAVYAKRGWHPSAIRYFRHAVALEPGNALFHYHLGHAYAASDDRERARESFQTAVRLNANFSAAREALTSLTH